MKIENIVISLICVLVFPVSVFALTTPTVNSVPGTVNANTYTLTIKVSSGAKVTVVGGPSDLAPVTDGAGSDKLDGVVKVTVGLAQEKTNTFSISSEKNGESSDSVTVTIKESSSAAATQKGDVTPPAEPIIDDINNPVSASEYTITGSCEADANIYAEKTDGTRVGSSRANSNGIFSVTVDLESGKTNRINVYAEDAAGNMGSGAQAVIQVTASADNLNETASDDTPFADIKGHWAESYITQIYDKGIVNGKTANEFDPDANVTRAELTKIALNAFGHTVGDKQLLEDPFTDVPKEEWYAVYIALAKELNIVKGFADGFHPNESVTRAAALKILLEASGLDIGDETTDFSDVPADAWFSKYVAYAKTNGIVGGYADNTFRPENNITRAEVAKIVIKILDLAE